MMALTIDEIIHKIGEFGRYHWLLVALVGYIACTLGAFGILVVAFITAEPEWICVEGYNTSVCNFTEPVSLTSDHYKARCDMPREAWTYVDSFTSTVTEYDLVCDKSILQSIAQSCFWVGTFTGLVAGGYLTDTFGRRKVLYAGCVLVVIATWAIIFPKVFVIFIIGRIVLGLGAGLRMSSAFVLVAEFTTEKHRAKIGISTFNCWVLGSLILPLMAYFIRDWRMLLLATAVPLLPLLGFWWLLPESPRWLLLKSRKKEAEDCLKAVAKMNKKSYPEGAIDEGKAEKEKGNLKHLFHERSVGIRTLIGWDIWFTIGLVYYGVSYGSVDLGGNRYLNVALTSFVELPSNISAIICSRRFGRKKTVLSGLILASVSSVILAAIPSDRSNAGYNGGRIFMALIAKFFINQAFSAVYVWSTELFPTFVRSMGLGTSSAAARIGSFASSYVIWLIRVHPLLPYGIMALICFQASVLVCFLPETKGEPTMETLEDMVASRTLALTEKNNQSFSKDNESKQSTHL